MPITTLTLKAPITPSTYPDHPALNFYKKYAKDFGSNYDTCDPEKYYNANCKMILTDRSEIQGGSKMWKFFGTLYSDFPHVSREFLTMIIVSDSEAGTHCIHAEIITSVYPKGDGQDGVPVPQSFVYTLGKADEGKGTDGLQFIELRNYYDYSLLEKAKGAIERQ